MSGAPGMGTKCASAAGSDLPRRERESRAVDRRVTVSVPLFAELGIDLNWAVATVMMCRKPKEACRRGRGSARLKWTPR